MVPLIVAGAVASVAGSLGSAAINAYATSKATDKEIEARQKAAQQLLEQGQITQDQYNAVLRQVEQYYAQRGSLGTAGDAMAYKKAMQTYNPEDYAYDPEKTFDETYSKTKEDFLNPYYSAIIGDTANQIQHTAAGAGLGRGTGAALNIAKGVAEKSDELYRTAMNDYTQDRGFSYQQYQDAITNNQNRLNALNTATQYKLGLQGQLAQDYYNTQDQKMSDILNVQQDRLNASTQYGTAMAGLY